jgi:P27 family predicted phage terminase small subunit
MKAPKHLRPETRKWWRTVMDTYTDFDSHHVRLLTLAGESWDRGVEARERIAKDGAYLTDRWGQLRAHPAVAVERDSRIAFARILRELALDVATPDSRPPGLRN